MAKSILITGASGFIGKNFFKEIGVHYEVYLQTKSRKALKNESNVVILDFSKMLNIGEKLKFSVDKIVHLAGEFEAKTNFKKLYFANTYSTYLLANWAVETGAGEIILASTGGVYGLGRHRETDQLNPTDLYALSKRQAEEILIWSKVKKTKILRIFFCYGPGAKRGLIPRLIRKVLDGEEIVVDRLMINPIYIDDLVEYLKRVLKQSQGGVYNIAGKDEIMLSDLVDLIGDITGKKVKMRHGVDRGELIGTITKAKKELNYFPQVNINTGLRLTYESMVSVPGN